MNSINDKHWQFKKGQKPWNIGKGGCKRGHDKSLYKELPSGIFVCLGCKRENGAKYRSQNQRKINFTSRVKRYNLDEAAFTDMYNAQKGKCAICKTDISVDGSRIDHNHDTGEVRGLLCVSCNTGIGLLKDSVSVLKSAIKYIDRK